MNITRHPTRKEVGYWQGLIENGEPLTYNNMHQDEKIYDPDVAFRGASNKIPLHVLGRCLDENQHIDPIHLSRTNSTHQLFNNSMVFRCRRLTNGNTALNTYRPLYVNVHGRRKGVFVCFRSREQSLKYVSRFERAQMVNYLQTEHNMRSVVDARLTVINPFKYAVCGPQHAIKFYCTGSGPSAFVWLKVLKKDPFLSKIFALDVHDAAICSFNRFCVSKGAPTMSSFRLLPPPSGASPIIHKCRSYDDLHGVVSDEEECDSVRYYETHIHYKQICFENTNRERVQMKDEEAAQKALEQINQRLSETITSSHQNLGKDETSYEAETEVIPEEWFDLSDEEMNSITQKQHGDTAAKYALSEEREYINDLARAVLVANQESQLFSFEHGPDVSSSCFPPLDSSHKSTCDKSQISWRQVKERFLHPLYKRLQKMNDGDVDLLIHRYATEACLSGLLSDLRMMNFEILSGVKLRLVELLYALKVQTRRAWHEFVENAEEEEAKQRRLAKQDRLANAISMNTTHMCYDLELRFVPHSVLKSRCDPIISNALTIFNHELTPEGYPTIQQYIIQFVQPPGIEPPTENELQEEMEAIAVNVPKHIKNSPGASLYVQEFDIELRPGENFFILHYKSEEALTADTLDIMRMVDAFIHFNGTCFDFPVFNERFLQSRGIERPITMPFGEEAPVFNNKINIGLSYRYDTRTKFCYKLEVEKQREVLVRREFHLKKMQGEELDSPNGSTAAFSLFRLGQPGGNYSAASSGLGSNSSLHTTTSSFMTCGRTGGKHCANSVTGSKRSVIKSAKSIPSKVRKTNLHSNLHSFSSSSRTGSERRESGNDLVSSTCSGFCSDSEDVFCESTPFGGWDLDSDDDDLDYADVASSTDGGGGEESVPPAYIQGLMDIFKHTKYISCNDKIIVDVMHLVAKNSSKMCTLNTAARRELGIAKLDVEEVQYQNMAATYDVGNLQLLGEYNLLDTVITTMLFMKTASERFTSVVSCMTGLVPRTIYEGGSMAPVTSSLARHGTWYAATTMPSIAFKNDLRYMYAPDFTYDPMRDFERLKYTGGTNGACKGFYLIPTTTVDASNMYPRKIMKGNLGASSLLTWPHVVKYNLQRGQDYYMVKLKTVLKEIKVVERVYVFATEKYFMSYENRTCTETLQTRLHYKALMKKETDPFVKANYNQMQNSCKLGLNSIYGWIANVHVAPAATITQSGCQATTRVTRCWKERTGHNAANADTDSSFLIMCTEGSFSKMSRFCAELKLPTKSSMRRIVRFTMQDVQECLDEVINLNQAPDLFLLEKNFPGGTICQGPKNYCGPKIEEDHILFHVAGLSGGKSDNTKLKKLGQFIIMHLAWLRDFDGALLFIEVVFLLAFVTILVEEVLLAKEKQLCDSMDACKKASSDPNNQTLQNIKAIVKEFSETKPQTREALTQNLVTLHPQYVRGNEKVGDMQKMATVACKTALLHCRKAGLTVDHAPMFIEVTRPSKAQISGVLTTFLETMLVDCPLKLAEERKTRLCKKQLNKIEPNSLTRMPDEILGGKQYRVQFAKHQLAKARKLIEDIKRYENTRSRIMGSMDIMGEARQFLADVAEGVRDSRDSDLEHQAKRRRRLQLANRAMNYMETYEPRNRDHFPLNILDEQYTVSNIEHSPRNPSDIRCDVNDSDADSEDEMEIYGKGKTTPIPQDKQQRSTAKRLEKIEFFLRQSNKHGSNNIQCKHIYLNTSSDRERTYDLWAMYVNSNAQFRWFVVVPSRQSIYLITESNDTARLIRKIKKLEQERFFRQFGPDYNSWCDERLVLSGDTISRGEAEWPGKLFLIDMTDYQKQTRSTPFITDTYSEKSILVNRDSFVPNYNNSLSFECNYDTLVREIHSLKEKLLQSTNNIPPPHHVHYLLQFKPIVRSNRVQLTVGTMSLRKSRQHKNNFGKLHLQSDITSSSLYCHIRRDDPRTQLQWIWSHPGTTVYLVDLCKKLGIETNNVPHEEDLNVCMTDIWGPGISSTKDCCMVQFNEDLHQMRLYREQGNRESFIQLSMIHLGMGRDTDKFGPFTGPMKEKTMKIPATPILLPAACSMGAFSCVAAQNQYEDRSQQNSTFGRNDTVSNNLVQTKLIFR